jgi:hypothetical protein
LRTGADSWPDFKPVEDESESEVPDDGGDRMHRPTLVSPFDRTDVAATGVGATGLVVFEFDLADQRIALLFPVDRADHLSSRIDVVRHDPDVRRAVTRRAPRRDRHPCVPRRRHRTRAIGRAAARRGFSTKMISAELFVSSSTVRNYTASIAHKTGRDSTADVQRWLVSLEAV